MNIVIFCSLFIALGKKRFRDFALKFLSHAACPLCHKVHPPHFHGFSRARGFRQIPADSSKDLFEVHFFYAVCFLCLTQYALAKAGTKVQYTYTVLPSFIIPRSRITLPNLIQTCLVQVDRPELPIKAITLLLPAKSPKTFSRLKKQLEHISPGLIMNINQETIQLGDTSKVPACRQLRSIVEQLQDCAKAYHDRHQKLPGQTVLDEGDLYPYLFARYTAWKKTKQECPAPASRGP